MQPSHTLPNLDPRRQNTHLPSLPCFLPGRLPSTSLLNPLRTLRYNYCRFRCYNYSCRSLPLPLAHLVSVITRGFWLDLPNWNPPLSLLHFFKHQPLTGRLEPFIWLGHCRHLQHRLLSLCLFQVHQDSRQYPFNYHQPPTANMPAANKPKLGKLTTPISANFPSEITSANTATPLSAVYFPMIKPDPDFIKTPISPPLAYTDFLSKAISLNSPLTLHSGETTPESAASMPESSTSVPSECSCKEEDDASSPVGETMSKPPATAPIVPPSPFVSSSMPMSAPPIGPATFPSLKLPPSPAVSNVDSPIRSPFSARSVHSVFDWEAALKARFPEVKKKQPSRTSVRHIREVVTRTVTYTPRMDPAPKGKRRKVE